MQGVKVWYNSQGHFGGEIRVKDLNQSMLEIARTRIYPMIRREARKIDLSELFERKLTSDGPNGTLAFLHTVEAMLVDAHSLGIRAAVFSLIREGNNEAAKRLLDTRTKERDEIQKRERLTRRVLRYEIPA